MSSFLNVLISNCPGRLLLEPVLLLIPLYVLYYIPGACVPGTAARTSMVRARRHANDGRDEARAIVTSTAKRPKKGRTCPCEDSPFAFYLEALSSKLWTS